MSIEKNEEYVDRKERRIQTKDRCVLLQLVQLRRRGPGGKQPYVILG